MKKISLSKYFEIFDSKGHPFISRKFISINNHKADELLFLIENEIKPSIGIFFGVINNVLHSPFSAPFGGIHFSHENIYTSKIEKFVIDLREYFLESEFDGIRLTLPPSIYGSSFNAKILNSFSRHNFMIDSIELTSFVNLNKFDYRFTSRSSRDYYNQGKKNGLSFKLVTNENQKKEIVELVRENRESKNRRMSLTLSDFLKIEELWMVDYFAVFNSVSENIIAGGVFYRFHELGVVYIAIWGDNSEGRPLRAMDFLVFESWSFYKNLGMNYIDLGISTEGKGIPNEGLLRFKETHEAVTEPRFIVKLQK